MKPFFFYLLTIFFLCSASEPDTSGKIKIIPFSKVNWEKLNPARGDKSPQAGTLWGDRKGKEATGFLAKFVDGFSSPPHIHNVSYKAIVIDGMIHNDDPKAANMWMPATSFWTQPAGEAHITSAKGKTNIALVEIDKGPYLVKPIKQTFDNGERPYNIHASNIIWEREGNISTAALWKNSNGRIAGGLVQFQGNLELNKSTIKIVVISGLIKSKMTSDLTLLPGSYINVVNSSAKFYCSKNVSCILYLKFGLNTEFSDVINS